MRVKWSLPKDGENTYLQAHRRRRCVLRVELLCMRVGRGPEDSMQRITSTENGFHEDCTDRATAREYYFYAYYESHGHCLPTFAFPSALFVQQDSDTSGLIFSGTDSRSSTALSSTTFATSHFVPAFLKALAMSHSLCCAAFISIRDRYPRSRQFSCTGCRVVSPLYHFSR